MDKIEVSQRAREAALDAYMTCFETVPNDLWLQALLDGKHDGDEMAQAFARFERDILATRTDATPVAEAWEVFEAAMKDPDYAWGWHCNLAVPIMDATGITHKQANMAAAHLMQHLWKCDITTHPNYQYEKSGAQAYAEFRIEADKAEDAALPDATHPPATDVAALVEENKKLRDEWQFLADLLDKNFAENDQPNRVMWGGEWYEGPLAEAYHATFNAVRKLARQALAPFTKGQNDG